MNNRITRSYLPTIETEAYLWLTNLAEQLPGVVANALGITTTQTNALLKALQLLTDTHRWQKAAQSLSEERTGNKNEAAWNPLGQTVYVRPNTSATGPDTLREAAAGAYPTAVAICDDILENKTGRCDQAIKDLLRLNPLPKKTVPADAKPQFTALIEDNQLTVRFTKARYHYFLVKIDHGTGAFDHEYPALESPFKDATPLPTTAPQIWRVQLVGYVKGQPVGIPGDIIDVAAKTYTAEHSEGAN
jgi:hypothetical protein